MKTIEYGSEYLRLLRDADSDYFTAVKETAQSIGADATDIAIGCYWFSVLWYRGQGDPLYASQCMNPFQPSCLSRSVEDSDSVAAVEIYNALVAVEEN